MSSSEPPKPQRRSMVTPSQPDLASPSVAEKSATAPAQGVASPPSEAAQASVVNTQMTGDSKVGTQPQSVSGPAPQFKTLGRYTVVGELGRGGMGAVFLAEDTILKRKVALKIPQFEPRKEEQMRARFIREAQLAAQLSHINICQIYDVGVIDGQLVMAMEYIEGRDLSAFTKPDKLMSARVVVGLVKKIALAVETAHRLGMVHRDLKPSNIMLSQTDKSKKTVEPKVMDFGLAKSLEPTEKQLTHSGMIVGTPCYMSKEQWSGKDGNLGPASDVFSLGTILYELLTGHLPYDSDEGEPATAWFVKLVTREQILPSERKPGIDPGLEAIVMRSIAKDVENRYATMAEFAMALDGWIKGKPTPAGPAGRSLMDLQFDDEMLALIEHTSKKKKSNRKRPGSIPTWLMWAAGGGAAALLLGIVLIYTNSKGETTRVEIDGPTATLTTPEGTITASTSPTGSEGNQLPVPTTPPPSESLIGTKAGDTREITLPGEVKLTQVWCPPGTFMMGTPGATNNETPVQVTLTKGFWLGQTEITQGQWTAVMGAASKPWSGRTNVKEEPNIAASYINHGMNPDGTIETDSATEFCEKLTQIERQAGRLPTGWKFSLPTEAQWEYACRAGSKTKYSFGDDDTKLGNYAWFDKNAWDINERYGHAVAQKKPNPWGLWDMHGNVSEWCQDGYADKLVGGSDPLNTSAMARRVVRGGSWFFNADVARSAVRGINTPDSRNYNAGFRVSMTPENVTGASTVPFALEFDGQQAYVDTQFVMDVGSPFTIELLAYMDPTTNSMTALASSLPDSTKRSQGFSLYQNVGHLFLSRHWRNNEPRVTTDDSYFERPVSIAGVWDGTKLSVYVNGLHVSKESDTYLFTTHGEPVSLLLGAERKGESISWFFKGRLDEVRLSKIARYTSNYTPMERFDADSETVALYRCDEGQGDLLKDSSDNHHDGKIVGAKWVRSDSATAGKGLGSVVPPQTKMKEQPQPSPSTPTVPDSQSAALIGTKAGDLREITLPDEVKLKQVWCPPGTFTMGTPGATNNEAPVQVTLTKGYWLGQTEVTQSQWTAVMGAALKPWSGLQFAKEGPNFPASHISHGMNADGTIEADSATAFCEKLTEIERKAGRLPTGWKFTLPTEAQWEYACRAGTNTAYSFGDDDSKLGEYAWWGGIGTDGNTKTEQYAHAVGTKLANPWGLYDMHGNVLEWCGDRFANKLPGGTNPARLSAGLGRVFRGGGWNNSAGMYLSAFRNWSDPSYRDSLMGFRLCLSSD